MQGCPVSVKAPRECTLQHTQVVFSIPCVHFPMLLPLLDWSLLVPHLSNGDVLCTLAFWLTSSPPESMSGPKIQKVGGEACQTPSSFQIPTPSEALSSPSCWRPYQCRPIPSHWMGFYCPLHSLWINHVPFPCQEVSLSHSEKDGCLGQGQNWLPVGSLGQFPLLGGTPPSKWSSLSSTRGYYTPSCCPTKPCSPHSHWQSWPQPYGDSLPLQSASRRL